MTCLKAWGINDHYPHPSFVIDVKNAIGEGFRRPCDDIKLAEVLVLDDIMQSSRLLGYVMRFSKSFFSIACRKICRPFLLPTLISKIWKTFWEGKNANVMRPGEARRVMERIRYLAEETRLEGENR